MCLSYNGVITQPSVVNTNCFMKARGRATQSAATVKCFCCLIACFTANPYWGIDGAWHPFHLGNFLKRFWQIDIRRKAALLCFVKFNVAVENSRCKLGHCFGGTVQHSMKGNGISNLDLPQETVMMKGEDSVTCCMTSKTKRLYVLYHTTSPLYLSAGVCD